MQFHISFTGDTYTVGLDLAASSLQVVRRAIFLSESPPSWLVGWRPRPRRVCLPRDWCWLLLMRSTCVNATVSELQWSCTKHDCAMASNLLDRVNSHNLGSVLHVQLSLATTNYTLITHADYVRRSAWVRFSSQSVCLSVCPQHNSKTNDPKVFKLCTGNQLGIP